MIRSLLIRLRRNPVIVGVSALAVVLAVTLALRGTVGDHGTSVALAADPVYATPLDDTGIERWQIEAPEQVREPEPEVVTPVVRPAPNVDWNALAIGVSDVRVSQNVSLAVHADVNGALSSAQREALISQAEAEAAGAGAGRLPGFVGAVVARGTPGGGDCAPTAW